MRRGKAGPQNQSVVCKCGSTSASGSFEVDGRHLVLRSDFGTNRVLLGLQEPRAMAKKLMKNICLKAVATHELAPVDTPVEKPVATLRAIPDEARTVLADG